MAKTENKMTLDEARKLAREYMAEQRVLGNRVTWAQACVVIKRRYPEAIDAFAPRSAKAIHSLMAE